MLMRVERLTCYVVMNVGVGVADVAVIIVVLLVVVVGVVEHVVVVVIVMKPRAKVFLEEHHGTVAHLAHVLKPMLEQHHGTTAHLCSSNH